jgi:hypothetical protein
VDWCQVDQHCENVFFVFFLFFLFFFSEILGKVFFSCSFSGKVFVMLFSWEKVREMGNN